MGLMDKLRDPHKLYYEMNWPKLEIVTREEWGAQPPQYQEEFEEFPVQNIILGWTETDKCESKEHCIQIMQELQKKHMSEGEPDIRFSYVVGWEGRVYEGRGFKVKAGTNPRFQHLKGKHVEVVLSGPRGEIPRPGIKSSIMWILIDQHPDEVLYHGAQYFGDYDDPGEDWIENKSEDVEKWNMEHKPLLDEQADRWNAYWDERKAKKKLEKANSVIN